LTFVQGVGAMTEAPVMQFARLPPLLVPEKP